jgi:thymidylate synthase (FAD)
MSELIVRPNSEELDRILGKEYSVLDHGIIKVVDYMGNDQSIVEAARISYGKGTKSKNDGKGLINYLVRHRHTSPIEMCEIKIYMKLPIFVARQLVRHRTASINEYSARYSILGREFYLPEREMMAAQSKTNKQGRGDVLTDDEADYAIKLLRDDAERCYANYAYMLNEDDEGNKIREGDAGISRELARMNITLNHYTEWVWKIDLHNLLHFLKLRMDVHAQYEIRVYADVIASIVKQWCPITYAAFEEYILNSETFSSKELRILKNIAEGCSLAAMLSDEAKEGCGLSNGERREFITKLGIEDGYV